MRKNLRPDDVPGTLLNMVVLLRHSIIFAELIL